MASTILVVEDEPHTQRFIAVVLEEEGYIVRTANDGAQALRLMEQELPDLILADIMMPVLDGIRLCNLIQTHPIYRKLPIILMSAFVQPQAIVDCVPTAYLPKPFALASSRFS